MSEHGHTDARLHDWREEQRRDRVRTRRHERIGLAIVLLVFAGIVLALIGLAYV